MNKELMDRLHSFMVYVRTEGRIYGKEERNSRTDTEEVVDIVNEAVQAERYKVIEEIRETVDGCDDTRVMEKAITAYIKDNEEVNK